MDLALNTLQRLICHKTQITKQPEVSCKVNVHYSAGFQFFVDYLSVELSGLNYMICLYLKIPEKIVSLIFQYVF